MVQVTTPGVDAFNRVIDSIASKVKTLQDDVNTHTTSRNLRLKKSLTEVYNELNLLPSQAARVAVMMVRNLTEDENSLHSTLNKHERALEEILKQVDDARDHFTPAAALPLPKDRILSEAEVAEIRQNAAMEADTRVEKQQCRLRWQEFRGSATATMWKLITMVFVMQRTYSRRV